MGENLARKYESSLQNKFSPSSKHLYRIKDASFQQFGPERTFSAFSKALFRFILVMAMRKDVDFRKFFGKKKSLNTSHRIVSAISAISFLFIY